MEAPKQGVNRNRQSRATAEGAHADLGGKKKKCDSHRNMSLWHETRKPTMWVQGDAAA